MLLINAVTTFGMLSGWNAQRKHHQRTGGAVAPLAVWLVIGFGGSFTVGAFLSKR